MSYSDFKDYEKVLEKFDLIEENEDFVQSIPFIIDLYLKNLLLKNFKTPSRIYNEFAICENIISPIITTVADYHDLLIWSHPTFDVDKELGLMGSPDFLIAPSGRAKSSFTTPVVCIGEVKQEKFREAYGQIISEMYASQLKNKNTKVPIYGLVTTGFQWKFAVLTENIVNIESINYSAQTHLNEVFDVLNWFFAQAKESIKKLQKEN